MTDNRISPQDLARIPTIPEGDDLGGHYYWSNLEAALTPDQAAALTRWLDGQTKALTHDGRSVVFRHDVERWVRRMPIVD